MGYENDSFELIVPEYDLLDYEEKEPNFVYEYIERSGVLIEDITKRNL